MKNLRLWRATMLVAAFCFALLGISQTTPTSLYGVLRYSDAESQVYGLMKVDATADAAPEMVWQDTDMVLTGSGGAVYVGGTYYVLSYMDFGGMLAATYVAADPELKTYKSVGEEVLLIDFSYIASDMTYDATTGNVYACSLNGTGDGTFVLSTMDLQTAEKKAIAPVKQLCALAADAKGQLFGIDMEGNFYKVNKTNAELELIGATGVVPVNDCSAEFDPATGKLFWSAYTENGGALYEVDATTGVATLITSYPNGEQITGLFVKPAPKAEGTPKPVELSLAKFEGGALQGSIIFELPMLDINENELSGQLDWTLSVNNEELAKGSGAPGEEVATECSVSQDGIYRFEIKVSNNAGVSSPHYIDRYVGYDTPNAPYDVKFTTDNGKVNLSWSSAPVGVNGGFVDVENLTHTIVRMPDGVLAANDCKGNTFSEELPVENIKAYYYQIKSRMNDYVSEEAYSNVDTVGCCFQVPFKDNLMNVMNFLLYTSIDGNADDCYWTWTVLPETANHMPCATYMWGIAGYNDDWLVSPAVYLEKGKDYTASYTVRGEADEYAGVLSAWLGQKADSAALKTPILTNTNVNFANDSLLCSSPFRVEESGMYHLGLHVGGARSHFYIYVTQLEISETPAGISETPSRSMSIRQHRGEIEISLPNEEMLQIVHVDGRIVYENKVSSVRMPLSAGIYVVKAGKSTRKVWVK